MKLDREKIDIAMARNNYNISRLSGIYGVSAQRMRIILNSRKVSTATVGRLADIILSVKWRKNFQGSKKVSLLVTG